MFSALVCENSYPDLKTLAIAPFGVIHKTCKRNTKPPFMTSLSVNDNTTNLPFYVHGGHSTVGRTNASRKATRSHQGVRPALVPWLAPLAPGGLRPCTSRDRGRAARTRHCHNADSAALPYSDSRLK